MNVQRPPGYFLVLEEEHQSIGAFSLLQCNTKTNSYLFLLQLDSYQSECFRVWLEHRLAFPSLVETEIDLVGSQCPILFVRMQRVLDNEEQAKLEFKAWVNAVLADKALQRSVENA